MMDATGVQPMRRPPRYWPLVAVFVAMTVLQASVAMVSMELLAAVRSYVAGESLYSKAQKDAQTHLLQYVEWHREADHGRFVDALKVPLGDRAAREALQLAKPDIAAARQGFLDGGNHPDDIDGLIRLFRLFQHVSFMSRPIATWTEGDQTIQQMRTLVELARADILVGDPRSPTVASLTLQAPILNERLTRLTIEFSAQLGEASRTTQRLLLALNGLIALLLTVSGLVFVRRSARMRVAAEIRMERLIDAVTDGVVTVDSEQRIVLFNRAAEAMFGVGAATALGQQVDRMVENVPSMRASDGRLTMNPARGSLQELVGRRADGAGFPVEASFSRITTERGLFTTVVLRDVSARNSAHAERLVHEALEASNQAKTEFLSRMSHELRTPLNAVIGFSQLLRLDTITPLSPAQTERIQHVESAGAHLLALVNDVLDLSRIESGEMAVVIEPVHLSTVVEEATTLVLNLAAESDITVFLLPLPAPKGRGPEPDAQAASPSDVWVIADRVRLRQVLVNLLSNAVKYNKPGGSVRLTWQVSGSRCELHLVDTGRGIPEHQLASLFQPFNRLGAENSTVQGTGIGLVLSRRLTELMGGTLDIASTFDVGTSACLKLSIASRQHTQPPPAVAKNRFEARCGHPLRVLYAEDNEVNAELVSQIVKLRHSISLRLAINGTLAFEMARTDPPDLMLVDMNLGDMTGIELAKKLKDDPATQDIRLVALSADALPEQIAAAMRSGFETYLTKPIDFEELLAMLDRHALEAL